MKLPQRLTDEQREVLTYLLIDAPDKWATLLEILVYGLESKEADIMNLGEADFDSTHKLALAKGKQLGVRESKLALTKLKSTAKRKYKL